MEPEEKKPLPSWRALPRAALWALLAGAVAGALAGAFLLAPLLAPQAGVTGLAGLSEAPSQAPEGQSAPSRALPRLSLVEITDPSCDFCASFDNLAALVRSYDVNVVEHEKVGYQEARGKELVEKYGITKVPALVVLGETARAPRLVRDWNALGSVEEDGALVARNVFPPYRDLDENRITGNVSVTRIVDNNCAVCPDPLRRVQLFSNLGAMYLGKEIKEVARDSEEGKALVRKYRLAFVPAVVFSREIQDYPNFKAIQPLGSIEADGAFVVREPLPPYVDTDTGTVRGLASVVLVQYPACWACWNAKDLYNTLVNSFGIAAGGIQVVDANSELGRSLARDFSLTYLPAALVAGDLAAYPGFEDAWLRTGRKQGGVFVLDSNRSLGPGLYVNAQTLDIVQVTAEQLQATASQAAAGAAQAPAAPEGAQQEPARPPGEKSAQAPPPEGSQDQNQGQNR